MGKVPFFFFTHGKTFFIPSDRVAQWKLKRSAQINEMSAKVTYQSSRFWDSGAKNEPYLTPEHKTVVMPSKHHRWTLPRLCILIRAVVFLLLMALFLLQKGTNA